MLIIFLHGALGSWDEILFIAIGALFIVTFLIVLFRSRHFQPVLEENGENAGQPGAENPSPSPSRHKKPGRPAS